MGMFEDISAKDILLFIFGLGGAWMFVKLSIKSIKDDIAGIKKDNERKSKEINDIKEKNNELGTNVAVILEKIGNTNDKIDSLYVLIESKSK